MTPYIQQQLKKLCDNPDWYKAMLNSLEGNPTNQKNNYNYLLKGLLENTQIAIKEIKI